MKNLYPEYIKKLQTGILIIGKSYEQEVNGWQINPREMLNIESLGKCKLKQ